MPFYRIYTGQGIYAGSAVAEQLCTALEYAKRLHGPEATASEIPGDYSTCTPDTAGDSDQNAQIYGHPV